MPNKIVFGPKFAFNCHLERSSIGMKNTMKEKLRKMVCGGARRCVRHVSNARKSALCVSNLLLKREDVCHV